MRSSEPTRHPSATIEPITRPEYSGPLSARDRDPDGQSFGSWSKIANVPSTVNVTPSKPNSSEPCRISIGCSTFEGSQKLDVSVGDVDPPGAWDTPVAQVIANLLARITFGVADFDHERGIAAVRMRRRAPATRRVRFVASAGVQRVRDCEVFGATKD
jgi:hypothetical protein